MIRNNDQFAFRELRKFSAVEEITKECPSHIVEFFKYTKNMKFTDKPDYKYCINIFQKYLTEHKFELKEEAWDWDLHRLKCIQEK